MTATYNWEILRMLAACGVTQYIELLCNSIHQIMKKLEKNSLISLLSYTSVTNFKDIPHYNGVCLTSNSSNARNEQNSFTATLFNTSLQAKVFINEEILNISEITGKIKDLAFYNGNNTTRIMVLSTYSFTYEEFISKLKTSKQLFIS